MSTSPAIVVDTRWSPILYIAYPRPFTADDWAQLIRQIDRHLDRNEPFGWINDGRSPHLPSAHNRATLAEHQKRRAGDYRRLVKGVSTVTSSALVKGIITAIEWLNPLPFPHQIHATVRDGERYVRGCLKLPTTELTIAGEHERLAS